LPGQAAATTPLTGGAGRTSETTNYEVSRLTRHRIQPRGQLDRLSVAVLIDDDHPIARDASGRTKRQTKSRPPQEIQKIHDVVAAAVGLDMDRGDQLTVENIAFEEPAVDDLPPQTPDWRRPSPLQLEMGLVGAALLVLFLVFAAIRRVVKRRRLPAAPIAEIGPVVVSQSPRTVAEMEGEMDAELLDAGPPDPQARRLPALTRRVAKLTQAEPENAARLLRSWLAEDGR
jgi:flagellar M-ring protein FliF